MPEEPGVGRPVALVTGASSGIGAATAARLADDGFVVHATARRADRLAALAERTGVVPHTVDVRDADAMAAVVDRAGPIDLLVNNAGIGRMDADLAGSAVDDVVSTIETNVVAVMLTTRAVLPGMIERGRGHVVNVGSVTGFHTASSVTYGASKAAVHQLSRNLRLELRGTGVRVTEVCPGRVTTEFYDRAIAAADRREAVKDSGIDELSPDDVADVISYAASVPPHVNLDLIELMPTGQTYGGMGFDPIRPPGAE